MSIDVIVTFIDLTCCNCGIMFAIEERHQKELRRTHELFYCPRGHSQYFPAKSDVDKERDRRIAAEARAARMEDQAEIAERRRRAEKGQRTKLLKRIENGVCPHCKRTFSNLAEHVKTMHTPDPQASGGLRAGDSL